MMGWGVGSKEISPDFSSPEVGTGSWHLWSTTVRVTSHYNNLCLKVS